MEKIIVEVVETRTYAVEVEAKDESEAIELVRDYDGDDLEQFETGIRWDYTA